MESRSGLSGMTSRAIVVKSTRDGKAETSKEASLRREPSVHLRLHPGGADVHRLGQARLRDPVVGAWDIFALVILILAWRIILHPGPLRGAARGEVPGHERAVHLCDHYLRGRDESSRRRHPPGRQQTSLPLRICRPYHFITVCDRTFLVAGPHHLQSSLCASLLHRRTTKKRDAIKGGLIFPGKEDPDYIDFAYFSLVIGMTSQVSGRADLVQGHAPDGDGARRDFVCVHTAILAMFVNIVASLI